MKKLFSFVCALVCAISLSAQTYYIAGSSGTLFGAQWDPAGMALDQQSDGTWSKTFTTCVIGAEYQFKVTDGSWTNTWGYAALESTPEGVTKSNDGNIVCKTYDANMTVVFDPSTNKITLTGVFTNGEGGDTPDPDPAPTVNYYLVGTAAENSWDATKAMPMVDDQIVRSLAAGVYEFKVLKTLGSWDGALGYNNVNAECSSAGYEENSGNVKIVLANAGDVTIKVVDSKICVTGEIGGTVTITSYTICGESALLGSKWSETDTNNDMTETETGIWTLVKKNLTLEATDYEYKLVANHTWGVKDIPSSGNNKLTIETAGNYEVTFTFNATTDELSAVAKSTPSALSNIEVENAAVKVIRDGQVLIVREGVTYNLMGQTIQ